MTEPVSAPTRESRFDENNEGPECINCFQPMREPLMRPWAKLAVVRLDDQGNIETLEEWPLCPDCDVSPAGDLVGYVKEALA